MYKIYPTLLNQFYLFKTEAKKADGSIMVAKTDLMASINREPRPQTESQTKGVNFENAVVTGKGEDDFAADIIEKVRGMLPKNYRTQVLSKFTVGKTEIYGFVDIVGEGRAIDLKTTAKYSPGKFEMNFQNLYLLGLKAKGISQLDYIITDFSQVYVESYNLRSYNFGPMLQLVEEFTKFLELNRKNITNPKIFGEEKALKALPLFPNS
jgi:hypothetical protein